MFNIFAFSRTYCGLKMKYYHPKYFYVKNMQEVEQLLKI